jgi:hypothetical protein
MRSRRDRMPHLVAFKASHAPASPSLVRVRCLSPSPMSQSESSLGLDRLVASRVSLVSRDLMLLVLPCPIMACPSLRVVASASYAPACLFGLQVILCPGVSCGLQVILCPGIITSCSLVPQSPSRRLRVLTQRTLILAQLSWRSSGSSRRCPSLRVWDKHQHPRAAVPVPESLPQGPSA